jgi:hypothetical protein
MQKFGVGIVAVLAIAAGWVEITTHPADQRNTSKTGDEMLTEGHYPTTSSKSADAIYHQKSKGANSIENQANADTSFQLGRLYWDFLNKSAIPLKSTQDHTIPPILQPLKSFGPPVEIGEHLDADDTESIIAPIGTLDTHEIGESLDADDLLSYEADWDIDNPLNIGSDLDVDSAEEIDFELGNSTIEIGPALNADD